MKILVNAGSGMGGTEKAAYLFAESLALRGHQVIVLSGPGHRRANALEAAGGLIVTDTYETGTFLKLVAEHQIEVIHQHVSGYSDHRVLYAALDQLGERRPRLIETNVFGHLLDFHDHGHVDFRMFITFTSGMQAFQRPRLLNGPPDLRRHGVLFFPAHPDDARQPEMDRRTFREAHGIRDAEFLVVRVGRPGHKWARWECEAFQWAHRRNPLLRMVLMEPNEAIAGDIRQGRYGEGIVILKARADDNFLASLYGSADLMLHASNHGESFGYTLAEGMIAGLPVITRATPWGDNAQVELIRHGQDGYVCGSVDGMARALLEISLDSALCHRMGVAAKEHILSMCSLENETDLLEEILVFVTGGEPGEIMKRRHDTWLDYIRSYPSQTVPRRYELERGMLSAHLKARCYELARGTKTLQRYFNLRKKGRNVLFPTRWSS